jgi:hypothetical protein
MHLGKQRAARLLVEVEHDIPEEDDVESVVRATVGKP